MLEKRDLEKYAIIGLILVGLIAILLFFRGGSTGFAVYEQGNQTEFNLGTFVNTIYNGTAVILSGNNLTGSYISKIFDANGEAVWNNLSVNLNKPNLTELYVADDSGAVYKSNNLGVNWTQQTSWYGRATDGQDIFSDNSGNLYIISNTNKEVWKSANSGVSWNVVNDTFSSNNLFAGESDSNNNLFVAAATTTGLIFKSINDGVNWLAVNTTINLGASATTKGMTSNSSNSLFLVSGGGYVYSSTNSGITWSLLNSSYGRMSDAIAMFSDSKNNLYIISNTNKEVWKSANSGKSWSVINNTFSSNNLLTGIGDNNENIYVIDNSDKIYKSSNQGATWTLISDFNGASTNNAIGIADVLKQSNLSFQIRSCDDSACSGESWISISNLLSLGLSNNRYFQYKVDFTSPDSNITPSLSFMKIDYTLVNTAPTISIASPQNGAAYGYNTSLNLNFSAFDNDNNLQNCWYNFDNGNNISLPGCSNKTFNISEGSHDLNIYANDSYGLIGSDSISFSVNVGSPTVILNSPIDAYLNNNFIIFSYTPTDIDLDYCELWGNFNGEFKSNQTDNSPISGSANTFNLSLNDGTYLWNIRCVDNMMHSAFNGNKTFYVDTTKPPISLTQPAGTKTSRTISASWVVSDASPISCKYNVYRGENIEITNTSVNCSSNTINFDVTIDADFIFNFYASDSAGNANSASSSFSVDTSVPVSPGGGSGGSGGGGGGSFMPSNQTGKLQVSLIGNIIANPGDNKKIPLTIKNIGRVFLNNCRLIAKGEISSWIYSSDVKGIAPGQNIDFAFDLNVPAEITSEINRGSLEFKCEEANNIQNISVSIPKEFGLIQIKDIKQEQGVLRINYTFDSSKFVGDNIDIEIWLADENETELKRIVDKSPINKDGLIERNVEMQLPENLKGGVYFIYFAFSSDTENFIKKSVVLSVTGRAVLDSEKGKFWVYILFLLVIGIAIFFIWKRHSKADKPEKQKQKNIQKVF